MAGAIGVERARVERLLADESARFVRERPGSAARLARARRSMPRGVPMSWMDDLYDHPPVWIAHGKGSRFWDCDGHEYVDFYVADMSAFCGHAPEPVVSAVAEQMARGNQFLLPGDDAIPVAEHLAARYGLPMWQFTLSASQANTEVIRVARHATGREVVLVFDGKYHGHVDATLVVLEGDRLAPEYLGVPAGVERSTRVVPFDDLEALERALAPGDVALVLTEPALTNAGFLLPSPGFHAALRELTRAAGTLLALDETHTLVTAYGGLTGAWGLEPDLLTLGKAIAAGVPLGAYGMTHELAELLGPPEDANVVSGVPTGEIATGGTLFANALSLAAGRVALTEVLTEAAFEHAGALGSRLANGIRTTFADHGLDWSVAQEGAHAYYFFAPEPAHDAAASREADDPDLRALIRVSMANRGVWESGWWLGPTVSVAHDEDCVGEYLSVLDDCLGTANG